MRRRALETSATRRPILAAPGNCLATRPRVDFEEGLRRTVAWRRIDQIREGQMAENSTRLAIAV